MKNLIGTILRTGLTKSKKPLEDYIKYLYPLKHILTVNQLGWVVCNNNGSSTDLKMGIDTELN